MSLDEVLHELGAMFETDDDIKNEIIAAELRLAEEACAYWKSIAPVDQGTYRDSIEVVQDGDDVAVVAQDPISNIIEYGSVDTPEFACRQKTEEYFAR